MKQRTLQQDLASLIRGALLIGLALGSMAIARSVPGGNSRAGPYLIEDYIVIPLYVVIFVLIAGTFRPLRTLTTRWITYSFRAFLDREFPHTLIVSTRKLVTLAYFIFYCALFYYYFVDLDRVFGFPETVVDNFTRFGKFTFYIVILLFFVLALVPLIMLLSNWAESGGSEPTCSQCGSRDHRVSAAYCFMCRTRLENTQVAPKSGKKGSKVPKAQKEQKLETECPSCAELLRVSWGYGMAKIKCPACETLFQVDKDELVHLALSEVEEESVPEEPDYEVAELGRNRASRALRGIGSGSKKAIEGVGSGSKKATAGIAGGSKKAWKGLRKGSKKAMDRLMGSRGEPRSTVNCPGCDMFLRVPSDRDVNARCPSCAVVFHVRDGEITDDDVEAGSEETLVAVEEE